MRGIKGVLLVLLIACVFSPGCSQDITLNPQDLELEVGETAVLEVKNFDPEELIWNSSVPGVVAVDDKGRIRAAGPGTAVITAQTGEKSATCTVKVTFALKINAESLWLGVNETRQNAVYPLPDGETVAWASRDEGIAKVDNNGNITGIAPGTTEVTASIAGETAECAVTVFEVTPGKLILAPGETGQLTVSSSAGGQPVQWRSGSPKVAEVDQSGKVTALAPGTAAIAAEIGGGKREVVVSVMGLTPKNLVLEMGESAVIQCEGSQGESVTWRTDNPNTAKVNQEGKVTAVGPGTAAIVAETAGKELVCNIIVSEDISAWETAELSGQISLVGSFCPDGSRFETISTGGMNLRRDLMDLEGNLTELPHAPISEYYVVFGRVAWQGTRAVYAVSGESEAGKYAAAIYIYDMLDNTFSEIAQGIDWDKYEGFHLFSLCPVFSSADTISMLLPDGLWNYDLDRHQWTHTLKAQLGNIADQSWSPDYKKAAWLEDGSEDSLVILDITSGKKVTAHSEQDIADFTWSPDGKKLVAAGILWEPEASTICYPLTVLSPEGKILDFLPDPGNPWEKGDVGTALNWVPGREMVSYETEAGVVVRNIENGKRRLIQPPEPSRAMQENQWFHDQGESGLSMQHTWLENGNLAISVCFGHIGRSLGTLVIYEPDWLED